MLGAETKSKLSLANNTNAYQILYTIDIVRLLSVIRSKELLHRLVLKVPVSYNKTSLLLHFLQLQLSHLKLKGVSNYSLSKNWIAKEANPFIW